MNNDIYLQFDFYKENNHQSICFQQPERMIETSCLNEVLDCLAEIDREHKNGKYIAGYMTFEASYAFFPSAINKKDKPNKPLLSFGVFDRPAGKCEEKKVDNANYQISDWQMTETKKDYMDHVQTILHEIKQSTFSQINYTTKWDASFQGDPYTYYHQLKKAQQSNYCAYIKMKDKHILSISPELFFHTENDWITLRPMKGTIHRGLTYAEDQELKHWLANSKKNQFENELTTNLMVDELKEIAVPEKIKITKKFTVEQYPTVYQMTSEIKAKRKENVLFRDILSQLFPCTSIAGTPKDLALQWIDKLEDFDRNVYCGTVGFIEPSGKAVFNVAIRTLTYDEQSQQITYGAGGAITEHSTPAEEYEEVIAKTAILNQKWEDFSLLETFRLEDGMIFLYDLHLQRLKESAAYFLYPYNDMTMEEELVQIRKLYPTGSWRIRLSLLPSGAIETQVFPLQDDQKRKLVRFADQAIDSTDVFYYHKTTNRKMYDLFKQGSPNYFDVLLWNEKEEITEFTIGNIVIEKDGKLLTPPLSSTLLNGTFRQHLLNEGKIAESVLTKADILKANNIWLINSVRKWVPVQIDQ